MDQPAQPYSDWKPKRDRSPQRRHTDSAGIVVFRPANGISRADCHEASQLEVLTIVMRGRFLSFPKGHIDPGETKEECAIREVQEETGITARILPDFCYEVPSAGVEDKRSVFFFLGEYEAGEIAPQFEEVTNAGWTRADEVVPLISFAQDREMYEEALAVYLLRCGQSGEQ